ncbi:DUF3658 domain-containing protein [Echinicola sp. 20G]|uniref:DUF3658 domain-containing protein n=1 Tax=Echinicola sp. 20G TaxID=2781961 RepID=UPI00191082CA|nr:DUF3658 domain-containing protein [Echinicola sp. 20G]
MASERIHIVFGESAKSILLASNEMSELIDSVVSLNDDLRLGPITNLEKSDSRFRRQDWLTSTLPCQEDAEYLSSNVAGDFEKIQNIREELKNKPEIFIWSGRATLDRLATARLVYELRDFYTHLIITDLPNIKIKSKFGHSYVPDSLVVMHPEDVHLLSKYFRKITKEECEEWTSMWIRLANENGLVRAAQTMGEIESKEVVYFDEILLSKCTENFLKAARVVGETLVDIGFEASDKTLNWRLIHLAKIKELNFEGKLNCLREYKVKRTKK